jgi:hypothetical protein
MRRLLSTLFALAAVAACGGGAAGGGGEAAAAPTASPNPTTTPDMTATPATTPTTTPDATATPPATPPTAAAASCYDRFEPTETIQAVGGTGASDLWAVGLPGVILHRDATGWSAACLPDPIALGAVWASGPADAWAVGQQAVFRFDGRAWSRVRLDFPVNGTFVAVWGSGPDDVWLLAEDVVVHHDGTSLSATTLADMRSLGFPFGAFREVWGSGADDVWIAADRGTLHWDGEAWWGSLAAPEGQVLGSVWAGDAEAAYTVGVALDGGGAAWRWDGQGWRPDAWQGGTPLLGSVRGAASGEVFFQTADELYVRRGAGALQPLAPRVTPAGAPFVASATELWLPDARGVARWDGQAWSRSLDVPR